MFTAKHQEIIHALQFSFYKSKILNKKQISEFYFYFHDGMELKKTMKS